MSMPIPEDDLETTSQAKGKDSKQKSQKVEVKIIEDNSKHGKVRKQKQQDGSNGKA